MEICRGALELGFSSFWVGDHVVLPDENSSPYPHTDDQATPFRPDAPWLDPLLELTWLAGQLPGTRFGTSVLILPLRRATLLAKQLATMSWLTRQPLTLGIGSGWLREEYDAVGMPFERRARRAIEDIAEMRTLLAEGSHQYTVRDGNDHQVAKQFQMRPTAPARVDFLWGGVSPLALRLVAAHCDGWLPAKQSVETLDRLLTRLKSECENRERLLVDLRLVVKPGPGPDPKRGAIDKHSLAAYAELGFSEAILEMPYAPTDVQDALSVLERVAHRSWL